MTAARRRKALAVLREYPLHRLVARFPEQQMAAVPLVGAPGSPERLESIRRRRLVRSRICRSRKVVRQVELGLEGQWGTCPSSAPCPAVWATHVQWVIGLLWLCDAVSSVSR